MARNERHTLVYRHVGREYLLSFVVAFMFFFFIFFINQILLIAQRILLKNVDFLAVFQLIILSIPQFLLYTFPFSSLTASSMVIGDLSSSNEILAMRASGISMRRIFIPIIALSLVFSFATFLTADKALPWSTRQYKVLYTDLMRDLPTLELSSNTTNTIGERVMVNKEVTGSTVHDIILFDLAKKGQSQVLSSPKGEVTLIDLQNFIYRLDLEYPLIFSSNEKDISSWNLSQAKQAQFYLDFSGQVASLATALPSQLSIAELSERIETYRIALQEDLDIHAKKILFQEEELSLLQALGETGQALEVQEKITELKNNPPINFYYQYYRAELNKKYALSAACFMLVFLTFSISFFRVKHGRLIGFGLSMLIAVLYWYMLFFAQMQIFSVSFNPAFLIWAPNVLLFTIGLLLLLFTRRL
ncbi:MAG TPA: YjgP/YjgQ family permease [Spirochaetales bacterium]|nr:YjgP/YjgQ family permease [Spirochaetales bacterium]